MLFIYIYIYIYTIGGPAGGLAGADRQVPELAPAASYYSNSLYIYIYMYTYIHTYIHIHTYIYIHYNMI